VFIPGSRKEALFTNSNFSFDQSESENLFKIVEPPLPVYQNERSVTLKKIKNLVKKFDMVMPTELNSAADELEFYTFIDSKFRYELTPYL